MATPEKFYALAADIFARACMERGPGAGGGNRLDRLQLMKNDARWALEAAEAFIELSDEAVVDYFQKQLRVQQKREAEMIR